MSTIPVVGTLLLRGEKVYLAKRINPAKNLPDHYCDAGGHIENSETARQAAWREVREETGLQPRGALSLQGIANVRVNGRAVEVYLFIVELGADEMPITPQEESANLGPWLPYSLDEALALPLVPGTRTGLLKLKSSRG
jgi:8-oxo-dGTP pyrophosphatase MutT (NUDIX family)